jgi:hypothetical protein
MDQRDQELLDKQMRAISPAPRRDGVVIVTVLMVFLAGMTLGGMLAGSASEPARGNERHGAGRSGRPAADRAAVARRVNTARNRKSAVVPRYSSGSVVKNSG